MFISPQEIARGQKIREELNEILKSLSLSEFVLETSFKNDKYFDISSDSFMDFLEKASKSYSKLENGYADFCKLIFVRNFSEAPTNFLKREPYIYPFIRTEYNARTSKEMPVLVEYASIPWKLKKADYLMIILYSREQMIQEAINKNGGLSCKEEEVENIKARHKENWYVVSIIPTLEPQEPPLPPITIWRNSLGTQHGGSGVDIDLKKYNQSVQFWTQHIKVKQL
jgi:hypothetical protein